MQAGQREMIAELAHAVAGGAPDSLGPQLREAWAAAGDDGARWRVVLDQVATLTDQQACDWHQRLVRG
jgi:dGTPase